MRTPKVIAPPTVEPVSLEEARLHLRIDAFDSPLSHPDDPLILVLITAAREWCESFTGRTIAAATLEYALDTWPCDGEPIELPRGAVQAVTSFVYIDSAGDQQTFASYQLDTYSDPPRILPLTGQTWPDLADQMNAVRVRYLAGFVLAGDSPDPTPLPASFKAAILLLVGHWYERREQSSEVQLQSIPFGVESLLTPYRYWRGI